MNGEYEADKYGPLIESLTPWARDRAFYRLKEEEIEDGVAEMRAKAIKVCLEIARGDRPQPQDLKDYICKVMLNALNDFVRQCKKEAQKLPPWASGPYECLLGDVGKDDRGVPVAAGWQATLAPVKYDLVSKGDKRPHFLTRFARFVHRNRRPRRLHEMYPKWMEQADAIPNLRVRAMVMLFFEGHEKADIARTLSVSRAYVTKALGRHFTDWDLVEDDQQEVRYAFLYVGLKRAIGRGRKAAGINKRSIPWRDGDAPAPPDVTELFLREEREVYKAIMNQSSLKAWTARLAQDDIRPIICALDPPDYRYYEFDWEEPGGVDEEDWLRPPVQPMS